ncbi:MAG: hypothetical protein H7X93_01010 [Sphingomonadaceae bacterium]|nr:hypothetical protein [Sphingomonadaceae bacterium]
MTLPGVAAEWRIAGVSLEAMALGLELVRTGGGAATVADAADPGRATSDPDLVHGPTTFHLLDLPALDDVLAATPQLLVAAAGEEGGWRRATLLLSLDGGASHESIGQTAPPAVIGVAVTALAVGVAPMFDDRFAVEVELLNDAMWLEGRDDDALVAGANLALLGDELVQFGAVEPLGDRRFGLTRLLRGRRGTEWAADGHAIGEPFVLLEPPSLRTIALAAGSLGGEAEVLASGIGDDEPAEASTAVVGRALRPPAPVHLMAVRLANGDIAIGWTRRSRLGWAWNDGGDAPLGEESERYALTIAPSTGTARAVETAAPDYLYTAAQQAADGSAGAVSVTLSIAQLGALAASLPAAAGTITL